MRFFFISLVILNITVSFLFILVLYYFAFDFSHPLTINAKVKQTTIIIPSKASLNSIVNQLKENNVIKDKFRFIFNVYVRGHRLSLKAGEYQFKFPVAPSDVLEKIAKGDVVQHKFTVVEGSRSSDILSMINSIEILSGEDAECIEEGSLLPNTYYYTYGMKRSNLIKLIKNSMDKSIKELWDTRKKNLPILNYKQAIILASIVELETSIAEEKNRIAAVFYNRIKLKMPLQADPTVIYGLYILNKRTLNKPLSRKELKIFTPYNTYLVNGLPPTAISNPSISSIKAVLNPCDTDELYFVADGTGKHVFAKDLKSHQKNHENLRKIRKKK